jgi:hypothetical protein
MVDEGDELAFATCRSGVEAAVAFGSFLLPERLFALMGCDLGVELKAGDALEAGVGGGGTANG